MVSCLALVLIASSVPVVAAAPASASCSTQALLGQVAAVDAIESRATHQFYTRLNDERRATGKASLAWNGTLAGHATGWSQRMSSEGNLYHARVANGAPAHMDFVTLGAQAVPDWRGLAENIGQGWVSQSCDLAALERHVGSSVETLHRAFVASAPHYKNMTGDFNQAGIGVHVDSNRLWVTVRFAKGSLTATPFHPIDRAKAGAYVKSTYGLFLDRSPSSHELGTWEPRILSGQRKALTSTLAASDEWAGERIRDLYVDVLGRTADDGGLANWLKAVRGGYRLEDVASGFFGSAEYFRSVGQSDETFVQSLYQEVLGRPAEPSGLASWKRRLDSGWSRTRVASGFYGSPESRGDRVETLYRLVLERPADPRGKLHWMDRLIREGEVKLAANLATSTEYYQRATCCL